MCFCVKSYELVSGGDLFAKYFLKNIFWHTWHCHHGKNGTSDRELFCLNTCNADVNKYINVTALCRVHINRNVLYCIHSDCWKWLLVHTFISDGYSRVGAETIRCKLHKEMSGRTNDSFIRKVFHLVWVVQNRRINVVAVFNQKPADINRTEVFNSVQNKESLNSICLAADVTFPRFLVLSFGSLRNNCLIWFWIAEQQVTSLKVHLLAKPAEKADTANKNNLILLLRPRSEL